MNYIMSLDLNKIKQVPLKESQYLKEETKKSQICKVNLFQKRVKNQLANQNRHR